MRSYNWVQNNFKNKIDTAIGKAFKYIENEKYNFSKDIFFQYLYTLKNNNLKTDTDIDRYASGLDSLDYKEFYALYDIIKTGNTKDRDCLYSDSIPFMNLFFANIFGVTTAQFSLLSAITCVLVALGLPLLSKLDRVKKKYKILK